MATVLAACNERDPGAPAQTDACSPCPPSTSAVLLPGGRSIADVADQVTPSVVSILSERPVRRLGFGSPWSSGSGPMRRREYSLGSGVIVSADGVIVTSSHVVARAERIRVKLHDGRTLGAQVVGTDPESDVAVVRVDASDLTPIEVADSARLRTGDVVLAVGNPFGVGQTVTMGIVSAVGRTNMGILSYEDFIQTDAAINPGNSGGALVDMQGQLVGINTAIVSPTGGYHGVGFAIPSAMAMQVKDSILEHGKVVRGWIGVAVQDLTDELARALGIEPRRGVLISDVISDGPAAKAGLRRGDVIVAIDGEKTIDSSRLRNVVAMSEKGTTLRLDIVRDGQPRQIEVTLGEQPRDDKDTPAPRGPESAGLFAGVTVSELDAALRARLRVPEVVQGVVVTAIDPASPAALVGLRVGDVLVEVNRTETPTVEAFRAAARANEKEAVALVYRDGVTIFISIATDSE